jgi:hypothetical protein
MAAENQCRTMARDKKIASVAKISQSGCAIDDFPHAVWFAPRGKLVG